MTLRKRNWHAGPLVIGRTIARLLDALRAHHLGVFVPVTLLLLIGSALLWVINTVAPLAPFVYSLF